MAKHCSVCNQDYADDLPECPHCAAEKTMHRGRGDAPATQIGRPSDAGPPALQTPSDSVIDLGAMPSDSMVDLGSPASASASGGGSGGEPASDASAVAWAALVDEPSDHDVKIDSPSDADILSHVTREALAEEAEEEELVELSAAQPKPHTTPSDSVLDLGAPPAQLPEGDSSLNPAELSGVSAEAMGSSAIDLGVPPFEGEQGSSELARANEGEVRGGSGIDLEGAPVPGAASSGSSSADSDSEVDLGSAADMAAFASSEEQGDAPAEEVAEIAEEEPAVATAEAEAEAAAEEPEEEKPAKAAKPRSRMLALAGATGLGILLGVGGDMGVRSLLGPGEKDKPSAGMNLSPITQAKAAPSFDVQLARVASGDWDEAREAGIENVAGTKPEELEARGEFRLFSYLKTVGGKVNPQDPTLQLAIQDWQKAGEQNADAVYHLALLKELADQLPEARAEYAKGVQAFANDPVQKRRFESAVSRVEWKASLKGAGVGMIPIPQGEEDRAAVLALLLIALQQPQPQNPQQAGQQPAGQQPAAQPPAKAENQEAGFEFWQAAKLAREGKFSEAITAIDQARKLHDQRRFTRLRKAQNPLSDPAEDIFLRCCDELKVYWQLENRLRDGGYLTDKNTPPDALQVVIQKADASASTLKNLTDQLVAAKLLNKDEDFAKALTRLVSEKKTADAKLDELKSMVQTAKSENTQLDGKLKTAEAAIKERETDLTKAKEQNAKLKTDNNDLNAALTKIQGELADARARRTPSAPRRPGEEAAKPSPAPKQTVQSAYPRLPNPLDAEKHFAAGLNFYFDRDFGNAEKELLLAVDNDSQDARYFYFLGLSRLAQGRSQDASADFDEGMKLERLERPSSAAVDASLERIQGSTRRIVNRIRERPER